MKKRVSRAEWLTAALVVLAREGVAGVRVERLARDFGIAKSGFYWHFKNRDALLAALLDHWRRECTDVISGNSEVPSLPPRERLRTTAEMILDHDFTRYEAAMMNWADNDPIVARELRRVYRMRLDFVGAAFAELGFTGDELTMRTRLFVCYHSNESSMFRGESKRKLRGLIDRRIDLLTRDV